MILFCIATGLPVAMIGLATIAGDGWGWLAVGYITVLVFILDRLLPQPPVNADPGSEFPAADGLLVFLAASHFGLLGLAVWSAGGGTGLAGAERLPAILAAGLFFGQISHPVAHELIHRSARPLRLTGRAIYASLLFGHHASAHMLVHHAQVGTDADPNSARKGEGFYRFAVRAWIGSFRDGWQAETRRRRGRGWMRHPYTLYIGAALAMPAAALALGGPAGVMALLFMAGLAQCQILMSDYVQHYGLRRAPPDANFAEPVGPQHSWNAPHAASSKLMLNAPRHSDHHVTPSRPFPVLQFDGTRMPTLPRSLPVMAAIATIPPLWRAMMDPLCDRWRPPEEPPAEN